MEFEEYLISFHNILYGQLQNERPLFVNKAYKGRQFHNPSPILVKGNAQNESKIVEELTKIFNPCKRSKYLSLDLSQIGKEELILSDTIGFLFTNRVAYLQETDENWKEALNSLSFRGKYVGIPFSSKGKKQFVLIYNLKIDQSIPYLGLKIIS